MADISELWARLESCGKRRGMGLLGPKHEILSWEFVNEQSEGSQHDS